MAERDVPDVVRGLAQQLALPRPMRRGSVSERRVKCNKPGCRCQTDEAARHGPYVSLVRGVGGKTRSRWVAPEQAELLRTQVSTGQEFRQHVEAYWTACEGWADAELEAASTGVPAEAEAQRGGSKRILRRKSRKKSKR